MTTFCNIIVHLKEIFVRHPLSGRNSWAFEVYSVKVTKKSQINELYLQSLHISLTFLVAKTDIFVK